MGKQIAMTSALRLREIGSWNSAPYGHSSILSNATNIPSTTDQCQTQMEFEQEFIATIPSRQDWENGILPIKNKISIYTDGSKLDNCVGGGIYSKELNLKQSFRLPDHCSVFQAEVIAIQEATNALQQLRPEDKDIFIYSDSQAAIKSLTSFTFNARTVIDCRKSLDEMAKQFNIHLLWVPGHRDIEGNCIADELARKGTTVEVLPDKERIGIPMSTCKLNFRNNTLMDANTRWNLCVTATHTKTLWPNWNLSDSRFVIQLKRTEISTLIGVITGHCLIGRHADRLQQNSNDYCRSCQEEEEIESIEHLICNCPAFMRRRQQILGKPYLSRLAEASSINKKKLLAFAKASGWF